MSTENVETVRSLRDNFRAELNGVTLTIFTTVTLETFPDLMALLGIFEQTLLALAPDSESVNGHDHTVPPREGQP